MAKINRTFSFTPETVEKLEMLLMQINNNNASDYIRWLIDCECERQEISVEKEELHESVSKKNSKSEINRRLAQLELQISSLNYKLKDVCLMLYQILNGMNAQLNYLSGKVDAPSTFYEYESEKDLPKDTSVLQNPILSNSASNYENKMRRLSIEKANKG